MNDGGILVIKLGALGDVAQALGAFAAIRAHHVGQRVVLLTTPPFEALFKTCPWFDEVWVDRRRPFWRLDWFDLRRRLRAAHFARVYDLQTTSRSGWYFTMLAPGPRPEWVGIARGASHRHADPRRDFIHTRQRLAGQLAVAGLTPVDTPDLSWLDADPDRFLLPSRFALLVPGASPHRPAKRWPAEFFAELAARLAARSIGTVVLGASADAPLAQTIRARASASVDLTGETAIGDLVPLGRRALCAIGNDTGPMHWLAASGTPTLSLFSSDSDPALCAPSGPRAGVLRRPSLAELDVDAVERAALQLLSDSRDALK